MVDVGRLMIALATLVAMLERGERERLEESD
jgi:hypothetical protein